MAKMGDAGRYFLHVFFTINDSWLDRYLKMNQDRMDQDKRPSLRLNRKYNR